MDEAKSFIKMYFDMLPKVTKYFENAISAATVVGHCQTILGRRRQIHNLLSFVRGDQAQAKRKVKNSPIQGTAADITKLAQIGIWEDPLIRASGARMIIQVHDEVVLEVPAELEHDETFNARICTKMEHPLPFELLVPLEISAKYADNWGDAK